MDDEFTVRNGIVSPPAVGAGGDAIRADDGEPPSNGGSAGLDGVGGTGSEGPGGASNGGSGSEATAQGGSGQPASEPLQTLKDAIVNRYSFDGDGSSTLVDSVGNDDGTFERDGTGATPTLTGTGALVLDGNLYGQLPTGMISGHQSVTVEAWVSWSGGSNWQWQRIFDFGSNEEGAGQQGGNAHYLFLTPENASAITVASYKGTDGSGVESNTVTLAGGFPQDSVQHVAVVVDGESRRLYFYLNGAAQGFKLLSAEDPLSKIPDDNNWLGRSQSPDDANFVGEILEFRIYDAALDEAAIELSYEAGPDAAINP